MQRAALPASGCTADGRSGESFGQALRIGSPQERRKPHLAPPGPGADPTGAWTHRVVAWVRKVREREGQRPWGW
jgi:hypothetical protein